MAEDLAEKLAEKVDKAEKADKDVNTSKDGFGTEHYSLKASNIRLIQKFKNPFKILYLWCS